MPTHRPWEWLKQEKQDRVRAQLDLWLRELYGVSYRLAPFLPAASRRLLDLLAGEEITAFNSLFPRKP